MLICHSFILFNEVCPNKSCVCVWNGYWIQGLVYAKHILLHRVIHPDLFSTFWKLGYFSYYWVIILCISWIQILICIPVYFTNIFSKSTIVFLFSKYCILKCKFFKILMKSILSIFVNGSCSSIISKKSLPNPRSYIYSYFFF